MASRVTNWKPPVRQARTNGRREDVAAAGGGAHELLLIGLILLGSLLAMTAAGTLLARFDGADVRPAEWLIASLLCFAIASLERLRVAIAPPPTPPWTERPFTGDLPSG